MVILLIFIVLILAVTVLVLMNRLRKHSQWQNFEARLIQSIHADPPLRLEVPANAPESRIAEAVNMLIAKAGERQIEVQKLKKNEHQWEQQLLMNRDYETKMDRLNLVSQLGQDISKGLTVHELFLKLSEVLHASTPLLLVQLGFRVGNTWQISSATKHGTVSAHETSVLSPVPNWVVRHQEPLLLESIKTQYRRYLDQMPSWQEHPNANSCLALPCRWVFNRMSVVGCYW